MKEPIDDHLRVVAELKASAGLLERIASDLVGCFRRGGKLLLAGNGGSAADAQHIAAELVGRFKLDRAPWPAIALTTDTSALTAISNDLGADVVFARQLEALATDRDWVWLLSVSGQSPNILAAAEVARNRGASIIAFTSRRGRPLAELATHCLVVDHDSSDRVQEVHQLAYHLVCERIEQSMTRPAVESAEQNS